MSEQITRELTEHEKKLLNELHPREREIVINVCNAHTSLSVEEAIAQLRAAGM
jgi:hypothetical protein